MSYLTLRSLLVKQLILWSYFACCTVAVADARLQPDMSVERIAFGSCLYQFESQSFWEAIADQEPDLFILAGDAMYADWDGKQNVPVTAMRLKESWSQLAHNQYFASFRKLVPVIATWDNHDFGTNKSGATFELLSDSKNLFLQFLNEPVQSVRRKRAGVYISYVLGPIGKQIQVILLDTRTFREQLDLDKRPQSVKDELGIVGHYEPDWSASSALLGESQWKWLESELTKDVAARVIVSTIQALPTEKRMDEWGNYSRERARLLRLLTAHSAVPVVILSGNTHFGEFSKLQFGAQTIYEITASGLTHTAPPTRAHNPHRVASVVGDRNFGVLDIAWAGKKVTLTGALFSISGKKLSSITIN